MSKAIPVVLLIVVASLAAAVPADAQGRMTARLRGFEEVPALSTPGGGRFMATVNEEGTEIDWQLSYFNLEGNVTQAHIHFGQKGVNGGIVIFLCSNLGNGPAGTQQCPADPAEISGTITAEDVIGASAQGLSPGELFAVLRSVRAGISYVNVHTNLYPGGEIRGQLRFFPDNP